MLLNWTHYTKSRANTLKFTALFDFKSYSERKLSKTKLRASLNGPFYKQAPSALYGQSPFFLFPESPILDVFLTIAPQWYTGLNKIINLWGKVISSYLEDYKTYYTLFCMKHFFKQQRIEIWFELIAISGIKRS